MEEFVYGKNPVKETLKIIKSGVLYILRKKSYDNIQDIIDKAKSKNIEIVYKDDSYFGKNFSDKNHQGISLLIKELHIPKFSEYDFIEYLENSEINKEVILLLDSIKDVGNLGGILRNALLFNVNYVILPKDNSCPVNDVVVKRSSGAALQIKTIYVTNLVRIIDKLKDKGFWIYGADMDGKKLDTVEFPDKTVIVMGEEGTGMRSLVRKSCDEIISIQTNEKLDSLNVNVSSGIILYEVYKKLFFD